MKTVSEQEFTQLVAQYVDVVSNRLETKILGLSDEFFAAAANLIKPTASVSHKGEFIATGAVYDGWETRRHNPEPSDYVIFQVGVNAANIAACEIDTAHFNGNEGPAFSVEGYRFADSSEKMDDAVENARLDACVESSTCDAPNTQVGWHTIFAQTPLGPSQRHFFVLDSLSDQYQVFRLRMYPDGGIARFRLYGKVVPPSLELVTKSSTDVDFASVSMGAHVVKASSTHFGSSPSNLLIPARGSNMGDGWETARSRVPGHNDWVIVKLGSRITPDEIVVDTSFYRGNYPQRYTVHGIDCSGESDLDPNSPDWLELVSSKGTPDSEDKYPISTCHNFTHVKLTIYPDGGVMRLRVYRHAVAKQ